SLSGNVNTQIANATDTVMISVGRIRNDSMTVTSGALRLRVFVTSVPLNPAISYYTIADVALNPLPPQGSYENFSTTVPLITPPDGVYYLNLGIFEQEMGCGAADGFCPDDAGTFPTRVQVINGVFYNYPADSTTSIAVEYYHAAFNHYFTTADPNEIAQLDAGAFEGWMRTGLAYRVLNMQGNGLVPGCRVFSSAFPPESPHFYTPFSNECAIVRTNPDWQFEGVVAYLAMPNDDGSCVMGVPLYRLYNNGMGGAPNHRYTTSLVVRAQMMNAGWMPEGSGIGV